MSKKPGKGSVKAKAPSSVDLRQWGDKRYGWLPYDYVLNNLASDFWSLIGMEWVDSHQFGI